MLYFVLGRRRCRPSIAVADFVVVVRRQLMRNAGGIDDGDDDGVGVMMDAIGWISRKCFNITRSAALNAT